MNRRIKITAFATVALLACLMVTSAFALSSTATVRYGSGSTVNGGSQTLAARGVSGPVKSIQWYDNTTPMWGAIVTKGLLFENQRVSGNTYKGEQLILVWHNSSSETGTFFARANGNKMHDGYCTVSQ